MYPNILKNKYAKWNRCLLTEDFEAPDPNIEIFYLAINLLAIGAVIYSNWRIFILVVLKERQFK